MNNELDLRGLWFSAEKLPESQTKTDELVVLAYERGIINFEADGRILEALKGYPRESYRLFASCDIYELNGETAGAHIEKLMAELGTGYLDYCQLAYLNEATAYPAFRENEHISSMMQLRSRNVVGKLGVLYSGRHDVLRAFMDKYAGKLDYCAVRFNYMDFGLEEAGEKLRIIGQYGLEAVAYDITRSDLLLKPDAEALSELESKRRGDTPLDWCANYLKAKDFGAAIVSPHDGAELEAYIKAFSSGKATDMNEDCLLYYIAGRLRNIDAAPPCTDCSHCTGTCPVGLDPAYYVNLHTLLKIEHDAKLIRQYLSLPEEKRGTACIGCGRCVFYCPKQIPVPLLMAELEEMAEGGVLK